jgi:hypothetical protein
MIITFTVITLLVLILVKLMLHGPFSPYGLLGGATIGCIAWSIIIKLGTYLTLTDATIVSRSIYKLKPNRLQLNKLHEITREGYKTWTAMGDVTMAIWAKNDDGCIMVSESSYSTKSLREFLTELQARNPDLIMDKQYQTLIDGEVPATEAFKRIPATTIVDTELADSI